MSYSIFYEMFSVILLIYNIHLFILRIYIYLYLFYTFFFQHLNNLPSIITLIEVEAMFQYWCHTNYKTILFAGAQGRLNKIFHVRFGFWKRQNLQRRKILGYLLEINEYLGHRTIIYRKEGNSRSTSKIDPGHVLWNIRHDGMLKLKLPEGAQSAAYSDDLALCKK